MPSEAEHLAAAARNKALAQFLLQQDDASWAAVLAFYSALHYVSAYLERVDLRAHDHQSRARFMSRLSELKPIYEDYRKLETRSRWVRYDLRRLSVAEIESLLTGELARIENAISKLLNASAR
jgi:hypothetical protein